MCARVGADPARHTLYEAIQIAKQHDQVELYKARDARVLAFINAYETAAMISTIRAGKRLPNPNARIKKISREFEPKKKKSNKDMFALIKQINATLGGEVIGGDTQFSS